MVGDTESLEFLTTDPIHGDHMQLRYNYNSEQSWGDH